jgi:methionyl-tRNA formyltransferase
MRIVMMGTGTFAEPTFEALVSAFGGDVVGLVTQPERDSGRKGGSTRQTGKGMANIAEAAGVPVAQPQSINTPEGLDHLRAMRPHLLVVAAYGQILSKDVLSVPTRGTINVHASLLPKYRGAAPITWAIVRGEDETGVCLMQMDEGMDTGPVFTAHPLPIGPEETADELAVRIGALAADVVRQDLVRAVAGELAATPQDHAQATLAPILEKEHGRIDWSRPAAEVHDHVRGMTSWPGAFTTAQGKTLKVLAARRAEGPSGPPGEVVATSKDGIVVACGSGALRVLRAQLEGKKPLSAGELVSGRAVALGMRLGGREAP